MSVKTMLKNSIKKYLPDFTVSFLVKIRFLYRKGRAFVRRPLDFFHSYLLVKFHYGRKRKIASYLAASGEKKLQLGAGVNDLPGWLNSEGFSKSSFTQSIEKIKKYIALDICEPFPFPDGSFDYVFHEHVIEHVSYKQAEHMLRECLRVLKPGGRMRVSTPNLAYFVALYGDGTSEAQNRFIDEYVRFNSDVWSTDLEGVASNKAVHVLNHNFHAWGHQFIYDFETLKEILVRTGFVGISRQSVRESPDPHLCNLECRNEIVGIWDALIVEVQKPSASSNVP